jgi:molecular chaperone DnaK
VPKIEVTFKINADGLLNVTAKDKGTGKQADIKITASTGLSEKEIEKMVKDAEQFGEKDKQRKELAEARNQADQVAYATEKAMKDYGDKLSGSDKEKIEKAVADLRKAKDGDDVGAIKRALEEVNKASHEFSKQLYEEASKKGQAPPPGGGEAPQGGPKGGDEKIIDADFKTK